jgi:hypothetical protein
VLKHSDDAGDVARGMCSFSADTPVSTASGFKPISDVQANESVLAYHDELGAMGYYMVTASWSHIDPVIGYITIDGEVVEVTPEHPFFVIGHGWIAASDLWLGAPVGEATGGYGIVENVTFTYQPRVMYNLTVAGAHTYFVGEQQWLVHNDCPVFRVEGTPNTRLVIAPDGNVNIVGNQRLHLNFGDANRAVEFYLRRISQRMPGVQLKTFAVGDELLELTQKLAVPQIFGRIFPNAPQIVDATIVANQFGFPSSWFNVIESYIIPGTGEILR